MNFAELKQEVPDFDEIRVIGRDVEKEGRAYHIAGMTRAGKIGTLYVLSLRLPRDEAAEREGDVSRRECMKGAQERDYFMSIASLCVGGVQMQVEGAEAGWLETFQAFEKRTLFLELMRAGWELPEGSALLYAEWDELLLTEIRFQLPSEALPPWEGQEVMVRLQKDGRRFFPEQPVTLRVGEKQELAFSLEDGRQGVCYIEKVYPIDVWKEQKERFQDPRYLKYVTEEELKAMEQTFFQTLGKNCPRGMCYLGVEYECSLEGSLLFYDRDFLDSAETAGNGTALLLMMLLKPDEPYGEHGMKRRGCVIQTPVPPDVAELSAELFSFAETRTEREEAL